MDIRNSKFVGEFEGKETVMQVVTNEEFSRFPAYKIGRLISGVGKLFCLSKLAIAGAALTMGMPVAFGVAASWACIYTLMATNQAISTETRVGGYKRLAESDSRPRRFFHFLSPFTY